MKKTIPYGKQQITDEDVRSVIEALTSEYLTQGPKVAEFETAFSKYIGSRYAVAVSNGTAALHLCALALGVNQNSNIITTPITFAASANCIKYCGGNVFFVDIDPQTNCIDLLKLEELIISKPSGFFEGVIPVDFSGFPINLEAVKRIAKAHNLWIIEDACHAPGGYFTDSMQQKQLCGNGRFADLAIFLFHPVKHIACGEGGMVTTNNADLYQKLLLLRTHGITKDPSLLFENHGGWYYEMQDLGYNYRLTDFQAALGISQLSRAEEGILKRRLIAEKYCKAFDGKSFIKSQTGKVEGHAYHLYIIRVEKRKELYDFLRSNNIFCQVHYIPVHKLPYYRLLDNDNTDLHAAEAYYSECLSLPMFPSLTSAEQDFVIENIYKFFEE